MFIKVFLFCIGFILSVIGLVFNVCYLNMFLLGYNFFDYVKFIFSRVECLFLIIGIFIMFFSLFLKGDKNELHL